MGNKGNLIQSHNIWKTVIVSSRTDADIGWFNKQVPISFEFYK